MGTFPSKTYIWLIDFQYLIYIKFKNILLLGFSGQNLKYCLYRGFLKTKYTFISLIFNYLHIYEIFKISYMGNFHVKHSWDCSRIKVLFLYISSFLSFAFYEGVFCFPTYSFSLLIFGCGYMREFGFSLL